MVEECRPSDLQTWLQDDTDVEIVDIRSPAAFRRGHIPDSQNVPLPSLPNEVAALPAADRIVTVCPHGKSSVQAARLINSYEGIESGTAMSLAGGLTEWEGDLATSAASGATDSDEGPAAPF